MTSLPHNHPGGPKVAPCNKSHCILREIRRIVHRIIQEDHLESRDKRIRFCVRVAGDTDTHGLSDRQEHALVVRRHASRKVRSCIHHSPEGAIHNLVEDRRRAGAVDAAVVVGGADEVAGATEDGENVAELAGVGGGVEGEGAEGGEGRGEAADGEIARDAGGNEGAVGEPLEAVDYGIDGRAAI